MDALITAAARALATGDALGALKGVALREDPPALALRGIAMAQLGEHARARELLRRAARGFGAREPLSRARCVVAEAEVALAMRDLDATPRALENAVAVLEAQADHVNASQGRLVLARRQLLLGRLDAAAATLAVLARGRLSPALAAIAQLVRAELALRGLRTGAARAALERADEAALHAGIPALRAEVADARSLLARPAARRRHTEGEQSLRLDEVETLLASGALVIDACRRGLRRDGAWYPLARRPVLFALARVLAEAWPGDASREHLIEQAFRTRDPDETHRARLRVELGRLRALAAPLARIEATARGFALIPHDAREVALLVPPLESEQAELLALLADGAAWSTSALALALDTSQRTVQRALAELEAGGRARAVGRARARRWVAPPLTGFTTILLLPATLPAG
ncbi:MULTISPECIES: helix-turn-helix domain-containing protein [unclassified Pseudoxanthomonas]|uniref:helix-turn-helix domain-containing protein n=1 Tax=unclassified Pseudoxanthomonas TaxID=2645906 RepID=UPI00160FA819|nr:MULTISPECIES: helix-turn-helix domain-containing protein [unclassified Pseudoxanthomonas]MBB3275752.1 tetratricopeptide (TPR) repeat protein [Pseudoxanthomonas sp. OG2]MBV7473163.1 helix-turn-helix domain-containing protein [Pseudoxanthomonas sp. PXM05]